MTSNSILSLCCATTRKAQGILWLSCSRWPVWAALTRHHTELLKEQSKYAKENGENFRAPELVTVLLGMTQHYLKNKKKLKIKSKNRV